MVAFFFFLKPKALKNMYRNFIFQQGKAYLPRENLYECKQITKMWENRKTSNKI